ncbi:MAG: ATP-binding protein [Planctomycetota bacterium]
MTTDVCEAYARECPETHGLRARQPHWETDAIDPSGMLDLLPIGALIVDQSLTVRLWNQTLEEWSGIRKEDAVGQVLTELFPSVGESRYKNRLLQVLDTGLPATFSASFHKHFLPLPARQGLACERMIQQTEVRRIPQTSGHALIAIQDVSYQYVQLAHLKSKHEALEGTRDELTKANEQLRSRNQDLQEFNFVASHDLQEPLRKITTFSQLLEEELPPEKLNADSKQFLTYIQKSAVRMRSLIQDLLALSKTGTKELAKTQLDLNEIVSGVLEDLEMRIHETNATIHCASLPTVCGDSRLLTQLYYNLIGNALKFTGDEAPVIRISAKQESTQWRLFVEDNGIGIEPDFVEKIFKPFQRLHSTEQYPGSGVGLAICRKAVLRHGGEIAFQPNPTGGSRFEFTLPIKASS